MQPTQFPKLGDVEEVAKELNIPRATLRDILYHAEPRIDAKGEIIPANGFAPAIIRIGRRVYLDRAVLAALIEERREAPIPGPVLDIMEGVRV